MQTMKLNLWAAATLLALCVGCAGGSDSESPDLGSSPDTGTGGATDTATGQTTPDTDTPDTGASDDTGVPDDTSAPDADMADTGAPDDTGTPDVDPDAPPEPLMVVSTSPTDGEGGVFLDRPIRVVFNRAVARETLIPANFTLDPAVAGELTWDGQRREATFSPSANYAAETAYTVTLGAAIVDRDGVGLAEPFSFGFSTGDGISPPETDRYTSGGDVATVAIEDLNDGLRRYTLNTTAPLRDNEPADGTVAFSEQSGDVILRTGHDMFDALFAMGIEETRQCSVSSISDGAFNNGNGVPCECFETGAKWNYVWTRDTAYAVDLGLAFINPARSRNSLDFKLSERKGGGDLQIVQDTGSGGSWPVSSDRVVWAIGAWEVLKFLDGAERIAFRDRSYEAMVNTIAFDRERIYDPADGLYKGEQSFLDWREQSYPTWTAADTVHLGMSRTLSTNVGHAALLRIASWLASEKGEQGAADQYGQWADDLAEAIEGELWLDDVGMYSAMKTTRLDLAPTYKYDLLGTNLAILTGVASPERGAETLSNYPHSEMGPPVLWPQQPQIPIYHNRGIWPFVTAYTVLAAKQVGHHAVFDHDLESLIRGAALNVSHMENFEFMTQRPWVDDGNFSGPVVNSRRQLWSVAGYIGAIVKGVFGMEATQSQVRFAPFVTPWLRNGWFTASNQITLSGLTVRGATVDVIINLPPADDRTSGPAYAIASVTAEGATPDGDGWFAMDALSGDVTVTITLEANPDAPSQSITVVPDQGDFRDFFAPQEPGAGAVTLGGDRLTVSWEPSPDDADVTYTVFRDGVAVATGLTDTTWTDPESGDFATQTYCYAIEAVFADSGNHSHHNPPFCYWGPEGDQRIERFPIHSFEQSGGFWGETATLPHYVEWGAPDHSLTLFAWRPRWTGRVLLQLQYGNGAGGITTGITASVKTITVEDLTEPGAEPVVGQVVMPHFGTWERWGDSSFVEVDVDATHTYRVTISDGVNMSYFAHFEPYTGGNGGGGSSYNFVNIAGMNVLPISGNSASGADAVAFDGDDDLSDLGADQQVTPGAVIEEGERFGLTWDSDYLYVAVSSEAFTEPYKHFGLYLQTSSGDLPGDPGSSEGVEYSNLTPNLPFAATHMISARQLSDDGSAGGPWAGVWTRDDGQWNRRSRFAMGRDMWLSADNRVISMRIPLAMLGNPAAVRLVAHVVNEAPANEWKNTVPASHTPWATGGGGFYVISLDDNTAASNWQELQ